MPATTTSLQNFVQYCQQYLTGDEKGESQNFLDRFFQAFGHAGVKEAGANLEERVKKGSKKGNTGFADLAWKPHLLVEMKKRGEDLNKHYAQAVTYWMQLQCPSYVMLYVPIHILALLLHAITLKMGQINSSSQWW